MQKYTVLVEVLLDPEHEEVQDREPLLVIRNSLSSQFEAGELSWLSASVLEVCEVDGEEVSYE